MATALPPHPGRAKTNRLGLALADYKGRKTTLCAGCGHNAITERILEAMFELGIAAGAGGEVLRASAARRRPRPTS